MKSAPQDLDSPPPAHLDAVGSFDEQFDELATIAHRVAFRIVGQREDARDITQEALTRAFVRWRRIESHAAAWVARVATNLALDHVRRNGRRLPATAHRAAGAVPTGERADLVEALRSLPRRQREAVVLRYLADLPETEVAAALGCSTGTVKSHAHRGLAALRTRLDLRDHPSDTTETTDVRTPGR
jgi:RNA polymerase sigma-70 factor (sigma-E family)